MFRTSWKFQVRPSVRSWLLHKDVYSDKSRHVKTGCILPSSQWWDLTFWLSDWGKRYFISVCLTVSYIYTVYHVVPALYLSYIMFLNGCTVPSYRHILHVFCIILDTFSQNFEISRIHLNKKMAFKFLHFVYSIYWCVCLSHFICSLL